MCWFQGLKDPLMPELNKKCIHLWQKLNPDFEFIFLDDQNIHKYLPNWENIIDTKYERNRTHKSDLLRLILLSKFGGYWCDSSLFPMAPLRIIRPQILNNTNIFMYRFNPRKRGGNTNHDGFRETASWFIASPNAHHPVIDYWLEDFQKIFNNAPTIYFKAIHQSLCDIFDRNLEIRNYINSMVQIDERIPHSPRYEKIFMNTKTLDSFMYKRPPEVLIEKLQKDNLKPFVELKKED